MCKDDTLCHSLNPHFQFQFRIPKPVKSATNEHRYVNLIQYRLIYLLIGISMKLALPRLIHFSKTQEPSTSIGLKKLKSDYIGIRIKSGMAKKISTGNTKLRL